MDFKQRTIRQARAVRNYARALKVDINTALQRWVDTGCAQRWAEGN